MNKKSSIIITLVMVTLAIFAFSTTASSQEEQDLLNQLTGKAEAPARNAQQLTEAYQKAIDYLIPNMIAENPRAQYNWQLALQNLGSHASRPGAEIERLALAKIMIKTLEEKEMPNTLKNWFVLQLERIGKAESVPALAKLLKTEDKNLRDYARTSLEKNPDASAADALLKELGTAGESSWKIGLLNSLGQRKAESAVPAITKALDDSDAKVAAAAVTALSGVGNQASVQALAEVLNKPSSPIYIKAAQGLVDIAQAKAINKQTADAGKIFDTIYEAASKTVSGGPDTTSIRIAAINGMINCNPEKGATLIVNFIKDENPRIRSAAVMGARMSPSDAPAQALSKILLQLQPDTQVQVLGLIGERKDLSSINVVKESLAGSNTQVRLASIDAMSKLGDASSAQILFDLAVNGTGNEKAAAHQGLVNMSGTNIAILLNANSMSGTVPMRVEAINLLGEKKMTDSSENLLNIAAEDNEQISSAAFSALAEAAAPSIIPELVGLISKTTNDSARNSGITTLKSIVSKAQDKETAALLIIEQIKKSEGQIKTSLLSSLSAAGGSKALASVIEAAKSTDESYKDSAIRTLCNWPDYEAAKTLIDIASKSETSVAHHVLAVRGILRLIDGNVSVPVEDRASLCLSTYEIARRNEEKGQIISAMANLPGSKVADKLMEIAGGDTLKSEAALAAVQLAGNISRTDGQAGQALAQKVIDLNISEQINLEAQNVISGRTTRGSRAGGGMGQRGFRGPVARPDKAARLASIKELETQLAALKAAIDKAPDKDPNLAALDETARMQAIQAMQPETDAITAIQTTLASLRAGGSSGGGRGGRGGTGGMGNTASPDVLSELRVLANGEKAPKTVARLDTLIKEAQTQTGRRAGGMGGMNAPGAGGARGDARGTAARRGQ
ncbi:MAG: HEAT repeat domain-containing protein [Sedimentisphaerales bacterium]|nr:HEAT repeat domain-containing protein [Sedimentisphaerales bacterium]